jgi:hypothetical protein
MKLTVAGGVDGAGVGPRQLLDFARLRIKKRLVLALRRPVLIPKSGL